MSAAHTPGPWYAKRGLTQMVSTDTTVAQVGQRAGEEEPAWWIFSPAETHGDSEADARLIAAALDYFAGAADLLQWADELDADAKAEGFGGGSQTAKRIRAALQTAHAKATGNAS